MKNWRHLLAFLVTGLIGSGAAALSKSRRVTGGTAAVSGTKLSMMSPEEAAATLKREIAEAGKESGQALKARLTGMFKLLGIEASWAEALAADSAAGFPALMEKLASANTGQRALLELILLDRWAQLDPEGGAAYFKKKADANPQDQLADDGLANFIRQWGVIDFEKAAAKAGEFGAKTTRRTFREKAKLDPAGFLAWAKNHPEINPFSIFISGSSDNPIAVARLAELDLDRVLAWAKDAEIEKWRSELGPTLAAKLAERSPDEAITWAKTLGSKAATNAALAGVAKVLADTDPTRALGLLKEMGGSSDYTLLATYRDIIEKLGLNNPDSALAVAQELPKGSLRDQVLSEAMGKLLVSDPEKAFALAAKLGAGSDEMGMSNSFAPKTPADARRVLDLAEKAAESNFRSHVTSMALMTWLQADQRSLAEYVNSKATSPLFENMKSMLSANLASMAVQNGQSIDPTLAETVGLKPEATVQAMAYRDPEAAAALLAKVPEDPTRLMLVQNIAQRWSGVDRGDAVDWATGLTNPDEQAAAYRSLAAGWMSEDSHRASAWIATLPPGKPRDAAVLVMAQQVASTDPDLSWQWGLTMTDPQLRTAALGQAARAWNRLDAAALQTALGSTVLNDEDRTAIGKAMQAQAPQVEAGFQSIRVR